MEDGYAEGGGGGGGSNVGHAWVVSTTSLGGGGGVANGSGTLAPLTGAAQSGPPGCAEVVAGGS